MATEFILSKYRLGRTVVINALGATDVQALTWEGGGPEGSFLVEHTPTTTSGIPIPQSTREDRHFTRYPFIDLKDQFFPNVDLELFAFLSVEMNSTYVWFDLNRGG